VTAYVITEGEFDRQLVERLLEHEGLSERAHVLVGHGKSGALSLARSILVRRSRPVALVLDADTDSSDLVAEVRSDLESALRPVAGGTPWELVLARPEIEGALLRLPGLFERVMGTSRVDMASRIRAEYAPKELIESSWGQRSSILDELTEGDWRTLASDRDLGPLVRFVRELEDQPEAALA